MTNLTRTTLGTTGLDLTRVGLGAWAIGGPWDFGWGPQDDEDSKAALREGVEAGINWIDTAAVYGLGHSEEVVGQVVRDFPEADRPLVFTKCGMVWEEGSTSAAKVGEPDSIRREAQASLARLGVEQLDLLQLHWPPEDGTALEDAWGALVELREQGVARFVGVSNFDAEQLGRIEAIGHVDTLQPPLSLINRKALDGTLQWCEEHGTGVIVYSPMQSGLLTGAWSQERYDQLAEDDWRRRSDEFTGDRFQANLALVEQLEPLASELGCSIGELAIAWTLHQPGVSAAICGARKTGQVEGWVRGGEVELDDDALGHIRSALEETGAGSGPLAASAPSA
jgi:aryl-alcohol dehydrogenase-like predicted oxidoreductase